ncbi:hypothetical protein PoB_006976100 [Plakobranchus ocellatus]|uniref:Uncharacterized protein n=1 Tax=Plakobranchus ocellatus TaxID=259542 RepID=A0AAV4DGI4_9GAST|nr:hypothetical protein PoB_006976100 [Plakobranchus ocellatus]
MGHKSGLKSLKVFTMGPQLLGPGTREPGIVLIVLCIRHSGVVCHRFLSLPPLRSPRLLATISAGWTNKKPKKNCFEIRTSDFSRDSQLPNQVSHRSSL